MTFKINGFENVKQIYRNLSTSILYEHSIRYGNDNIKITDTGALSILTGEKTGRCPNDKRIVNIEYLTKDIWWGDESPNIPINKNSFKINKSIAINYLNTLDNLYIFDGYIGWDLKYRQKIRIISSRPYHMIFCNNMFIKPNEDELGDFVPNYTIFNAGSLKACELIKDVSSNTSISFDLEDNEIVILGSEYTGEMKKGIFTIMHYLMPLKNILSLHSSVNVGKYEDDVTIFFGLSGTGKTTLSSDPNRFLIGDDEHCWTCDGLFNIEGGCYAKCINLSREKEKDIYDAINFGSLLENVRVDNISRKVNFNDCSITNNTRVSYSIDKLPNAIIPCKCKHPKNIIFLTCDAYGLMPLVSKLSNEQAMYYFLIGYTSKIPGTEMDITDPISTFSPCYGSAFLIWHPTKYAKMLFEKISSYNVDVWLVNTGWVSEYSNNGKRIELRKTRQIINEINSGLLSKQKFKKISNFNLSIPTKCGDINETELNPVNMWDNKESFYKKYNNLVNLFNINFEKIVKNSEFEYLKKYGPQIISPNRNK